MEDIHELKPLMGMDFPWLSVGLFSLILLLIFWGMAALIWRLTKRKKPKAMATAPPIKAKPLIDPREQALKALKKLKPQASDPETFYIKLEQILRTYLSAHYQLGITSYTGSELSQFFQEQAYHRRFNTHHLKPLLQMLSHGEQAKFAKQNLTEVLQATDLQIVQDFINGTPLSKQNA